MNTRFAQRELESIALSHGFALHRSSGKHLIWRHATGAQVVSAKTPSDRRSLKNFERDCRRAFTTVHHAKAALA